MKNKVVCSQPDTPEPPPALQSRSQVFRRLAVRCRPGEPLLRCDRIVGRRSRSRPAGANPPHD